MGMKDEMGFEAHPWCQEAIDIWLDGSSEKQITDFAIGNERWSQVTKLKIQCELLNRLACWLATTQRLKFTWVGDEDPPKEVVDEVKSDWWAKDLYMSWIALPLRIPFQACWVGRCGCNHGHCNVPDSIELISDPVRTIEDALCLISRGWMNLHPLQKQKFFSWDTRGLLDEQTKIRLNSCRNGIDLFVEKEEDQKDLIQVTRSVQGAPRVFYGYPDSVFVTLSVDSLPTELRPNGCRGGVTPAAELKPVNGLPLVSLSASR